MSIRTKILLSLLVPLIVLLVASDILWFREIQPMVESQVTASQQQLSKRGAEKVDDFIQAKIRAMIIHSQTTAFLLQDFDQQEFEIESLFLQDPDIQRLVVTDAKGVEVLDLYRQDGDLVADTLDSRLNDPVYVVPAFRFGQEFISEVTYEASIPIITISVPITPPRGSDALTDLSTFDISGSNALLGVMAAEVSLNDLFSELQNLQEEIVGEVFVVDRQGIVIAHSNSEVVQEGLDFSRYSPVAKHLEDVRSSRLAKPVAHSSVRYTNHEGVEVFGMHAHVKESEWGVIIEQPVDEVLAGLSNATAFAVIVLVLGILVVVPFAFLLSRQLVAPINKLVDGVRVLAAGKFGKKLVIRTGDEIEVLANAFNKMAMHLGESISHLKEDKEIIEQERLKLYTVISGVIDGVVALDNGLHVVLANPAAQKILGMQEDEMVTKHIDEVLHATSIDGGRVLFADEAQSLGKGKNIAVFDRVSLHCVTECSHDIRISILGVADSDAVGIHYLVVLHDLKDELELERMKLDFVSMAAHELRTPLATVRGYISFLQEPDTLKKLSEEEVGFLAKAGISAVRLNNLVENLLSASRIEKGVLHFSFEKHDYDETIRSIVDDFVSMAETKGLTLSLVEPNEPVGDIVFDKLRIEEVLVNLIGNAINYTQRGTIRVSYRRERDRVVTEIADTGQGIPEQSLPHLFTKFFRVQGRLQSGSKGTGLGLFISKQIIDSHHGTISVKSTLHEGSVFSFTLPVEQVEPENHADV